MNIITKEWTRPASSGEGTIFSRLWAAEQPGAILMIAHGMCEHSARYDAFARYLAEHGWAVCMNDHAGHGRSAVTPGYFAAKNGWDCVVQDLHALLTQVKELYPGLPLCIMGHSMGSFLVREYITLWGAGLDACILSATMGRNPSLGAAILLARMQCLVKGPKSPGILLDRLSTGGYTKHFADPVNEFAWLSANPQNCLDYAADPDCGFVFTAKAYEDLSMGLKAVTGPKWAKKVPHSLPILVVAGADDVMGSEGKGPAQVAGWLKSAGCHDVSLSLYAGMRHEILNETDREKVFQDLRLWLEAHL